MKTILCPTDFSPVAQNGILYAAEFAKRSGASLTLFHTEFFPRPVTTPDNDEREELINLPKEYIGELKEKFICLVNQLRLNYPEVKFNYVIEEGLVAENIAFYADHKHIDMIVMGTHGATGFEAFFEGSNAVSVMEKAKCPVLIIPEKVEYKVPGTFVYAVDLIENEEPVIEEVLAIAALFDAKLELLHIKSEDALELVNSNISLNSLLEKFSNHQLTTKIIDSPDSIDAIEEYARSQADILVMANKKKGFFERLFSRNRTERIAHDAEVPLLVVHKK